MWAPAGTRTWDDVGYAQITYGTISGTVSRATSGLMTRAWAYDVNNSGRSYCAGVEALSTTFVVLYLFYSGPDVGKMRLTTINSSGTGLNWKLLDWGVVTDGDDIGIHSITAKGCRVLLCGLHLRVQ